MSQCVILAGGLATRMRPLTESIPKALIAVGEHPFVHHQLRWLATHGVTRVVFCIGYRGDGIRDYVGDGCRWGLTVTYVDEGTELKGTGGAIRKALDEGVLEPMFLVTYGDSYLPVDFEAVFQAFLGQNRPALMTVYRNRGKWDTSNARYENGQVTLYLKGPSEGAGDGTPQFIDYGLLAFRRELIEKEIPAGVKQDLAPLLNLLSVRGDLAGYEVDTRFYEIGSPQGLEELQALIAPATER